MGYNKISIKKFDNLIYKCYDREVNYLSSLEEDINGKR